MAHNEDKVYEVMYGIEMFFVKMGWTQLEKLKTSFLNLP